jgi:hypothetical protein
VFSDAQAYAPLTAARNGGDLEGSLAAVGNCANPAIENADKPNMQQERKKRVEPTEGSDWKGKLTLKCMGRES